LLREVGYFVLVHGHDWNYLLHRTKCQVSKRRRHAYPFDDH
jgi:hypothetical protein